ncbi:MogA/MoaB family molybdenum cofactor biosynthesis protein [Desulfovibrio sp. OttesenSCG-928-O18]|nr:MogA/MoaB family molybdenum cofactor biosynthesis protein [Desulfovibrio sp. OttesenSCG-928-O18]
MYKVAVLAINHKAYSGERPDESGKAVMDVLEKNGFSVVHYAISPYELPFISAELMRLCDENLADIVLTTGGTGLGKRDVTPEATQDVVERVCQGIPEAMRARALPTDKRAMLSRAIAGIRGETLIVNLPGNPAAARDCVEYLVCELKHALDMLKR